MLVQIVSIVFPVFTVIAVGYLYGRKHRPDMLATNQVNMGIFVPALIFSALAGKSVDLAEVQMIALGIGGVGRHRDAPRRHNAQIGDAPFGPVFGNQHDAVALFQTQLTQRFCKSGNLLGDV